MLVQNMKTHQKPGTLVMPPSMQQHLYGQHQIQHRIHQQGTLVMELNTNTGLEQHLLTQHSVLYKL